MKVREELKQPTGKEGFGESDCVGRKKKGIFIWRRFWKAVACLWPLSWHPSYPSVFLYVIFLSRSVNSRLPVTVWVLSSFACLPTQTPILTVCPLLVLKHKCTPAVCIVTIGIWQGFVSIRLSRLEESATQKWSVEVVGGSQYFMSRWNLGWDKGIHEVAPLLIIQSPFKHAQDTGGVMADLDGDLSDGWSSQQNATLALRWKNVNTLLGYDETMHFEQNSIQMPHGLFVFSLTDLSPLSCRC